MMAVSQGMVEELVGVCGAEFVRVEDGLVEVAPGTTEEVAAVLRYANARGLALNAWGGGTKQGWCNDGPAAVRLRTTRMHRVLEHPWQDMTCTVQAGCTWAAMQEQLMAHGQFVALDPVFAKQATVGGIAAVNDSGSLRLKYGSLRDLIIGMTVVLADGTIARTGGKVVKNVAGYDLHKLMTGALGTLGIITEVVFRLHSVPRHTASFAVGSQKAEPLGALLMKVIDSHLSMERVQMRADKDGYSMEVQLAALPEVVTEQAQRLGTMAVGLGLVSGEAGSEVWSLRQGCFERRDTFVVKVTMLPAEIAKVSAMVRELGGESVTQAMGVMIAALPSEVTELRKKVEAAGGTVVVLQQPGGASMDRWGTMPDTLPLMREIKQLFDPKRILNPGRYLGGI